MLPGDYLRSLRQAIFILFNGRFLAGKMATKCHNGGSLWADCVIFNFALSVRIMKTCPDETVI